MSNVPVTHRVRFHLGAGKHYMHWQVRSSNGEVRFYDPETTRLRLWSCLLKRQPKAARLIYLQQSRKTVCAWIFCSDFRAYRVDDKTPPTTVDLGQRPALRFNPRDNPCWLMRQSTSDCWHTVDDDSYFSHISIIGRALHPYCYDNVFETEFFDYCPIIPPTEGVIRNGGVRALQGR